MVSHHAQIQRYNRHYGKAVVTGLFGCRWQRYKQSKDDTPKRDIAWIILLFFTTAFLAFWFYFWLMAGNSHDSVNWHMWTKLGKWYDWHQVVLVVTSITLLYVAILVVLAFCHVGLGYQVFLHYIHRMILLLVLAACVAVIFVVQSVWAEGFQLELISVMITGPFLQVSAVVVMTFLTWFIAGQLILLQCAWRRMCWLGLYITVMASLYLSPMSINSPCIGPSKDLPQRPLLVAHRGAAAIAPENTLEAFRQAAVEDDVIVLESDITVSYDGVPFVMHDGDLRRTTNVATVFPERAHMKACQFNMTDLKRLSAGAWFHKKDPFGTASSLTAEQRAVFANQSIPTLEEYLMVAKETNKSVLFDIYFDLPPGAKHPHAGFYGQRVVDVILSSGINNSQVWWLYKGRYNNAENFTSVATEGSATSLVREGVFIVNAGFGHVTWNNIRDYKTHNITTNVWVVDSAWLHSLYWCMGVSSVTTNRCRYLAGRERPVWHLTRAEFLLLWIITDIFSLIAVICVFVIQRKRHQWVCYHPETISLQSACVRMTHKNQNYTMKEKLLLTAEGLQEIDHSCVGVMSDLSSPDSTTDARRPSNGVVDTVVRCNSVSSTSTVNTGVVVGVDAIVCHTSTRRPSASNGVTASADDSGSNTSFVNRMSGISSLSMMSGMTAMSDSSSPDQGDTIASKDDTSVAIQLNEIDTGVST
ncbi:Glycerophosphodiester phosphodiesterase domain-containing protein 5 [Lamellibrachia satsuma]|nr:Glycerophosphodiester phosphodiesterase domain-containing protein 5 [Lamellibrachia satsuma]